MSHTPGESPFDITAFEAAAKARVAEFVGEVSRVAALEMREESEEWLAVRGAQYALSDGMVVAARHEVWDGNPEKVVTKVRVASPFVESLGADGNLRRVQVARLIVGRTFLDGLTDEQIAALPESDFPEPPGLEELGKAWFAGLEQSRLEDRLKRGWRPGELIWARTVTSVECKLPNSHNFRTERPTPTLAPATRTAHVAARRHAGEPVENTPYDVAEHQGVIALLSSIDPGLMELLPLERDFEETWLDPEPNIRSWWPKGWKR